MTARRALLHICCAPDASVPWPALLSEGFETDGFFYGGNIHPESEWRKRREAVEVLAASIGGFAAIAPYDVAEWRLASLGFEEEPEGGARCAACFRVQLEAAAAHAASAGYSHLCSTLTISPHKNPALINAIGAEAAAKSGLEWIERVWRKNDGFKKSVEASARLGLYRQNYCGCAYSAPNFSRNR
jgi:predicted adenine nucleotide alpha hydrolase (AANH) superfamily ATPase